MTTEDMTVHVKGLNPTSTALNLPSHCHHVALVRALASHQCGLGSNPGVDTICGLSLLLVLSLAPRGFSPVFPSPQNPIFPDSNSIRNQVDEELLCGCAIS